MFSGVWYNSSRFCCRMLTLSILQHRPTRSCWLDESNDGLVLKVAGSSFGITGSGGYHQIGADRIELLRCRKQYSVPVAVAIQTVQNAFKYTKLHLTSIRLHSSDVPFRLFTLPRTHLIVILDISKSNGTSGKGGTSG